MRTETTSAALPINAKGDGNGSDFDPKELPESPDKETNILSDGRAPGPAFTTNTTPGHAERSTAADIDIYDTDEDSDPSEGEEGGAGWDGHAGTGICFADPGKATRFEPNISRTQFRISLVGSVCN